MRISFSRSGGMAGLMRPPLVIDSANLSAPKAQLLARLVDKAASPPSSTKTAESGQADRFQYEIDIEHGDGTKHHHVLNEATLSAGQRALVEFLQDLAKKT